MAGVREQFRQFLQGPLFRQGGVVLADQGLLSLTNFLTGVLVARACSTGDYGTYVLIWSVLMIVLSVYKALVHIPLTVFLPRLAPAEGHQFQGSALVHTVAIAMVAAAAVLALPALASPTPGTDLARLAGVGWLAAILLLPFLLREFARNALFSRLQFNASVMVSVLATALQLAAAGLLFFTGHLSLETAMAVLVVTGLLASGIMLWLHREQMRVAWSRVWSDLARGWHVSRWSLLNVVGMIGTSQAFPWLLLGLQDASAVAVYGAASAMAGVMAPFLQAANAYVLPRMSHGFKDGDVATLSRMLRRAMVGLSIPYGVWVLVGGVFADVLMTLLYSERYAGYANVVWLLLLRGLAEAVAAPMNPALQALEKTRVTTEALFLGSLGTFTVGWWAIREWGLTGAAAAAFATTLVVTGYKYWRVSRLLAAR